MQHIAEDLQWRKATEMLRHLVRRRKYGADSNRRKRCIHGCLRFAFECGKGGAAGKEVAEEAKEAAMAVVVASVESRQSVKTLESVAVITFQICGM